MTNRKYHILIVDDEQDICEILKFNLETEGYLVETVHSAEEAMETGVSTFDLILLDVMMGGMSGFSMAKMLKANDTTKSIPIIFLTARDTENDTITGFTIGADDYISKPFSIREVTMRIRAVLNRTGENTPSQPSVVGYQGLRINLDTKTVTVDGKETAFTKTEYELLRLLIEERGRVFSRQDLIERVWPRDVFVLEHTVDVNITRLRKKIGPYSKLIATRIGFGYYFNA